MVIYSKEFRLICNSWLTFLGYSNKVTRKIKGVSDVNASPIVAMRWFWQLSSLERSWTSWNSNRRMHLQFAKRGIRYIFVIGTTIQMETGSVRFQCRIHAWIACEWMNQIATEWMTMRLRIYLGSKASAIEWPTISFKILSLDLILKRRVDLRRTYQVWNANTCDNQPGPTWWSWITNPFIWWFFWWLGPKAKFANRFDQIK